MLTCWQVSSSWPVAASWNEPARPPSRPRDSSSVTSRPRGARTVAAARPARPPPMITTFCAIHPSACGLAPPPQAYRQYAQRQHQLAPAAQPDAATEDVVIAPLDLVEQPAVGACHEQEHRPPAR